MILDSVITCPACGARHAETMPVDAWQILYQCTECLAVLRPRPGQCCVFCAYGSAACPHAQARPRRSGPWR